MEHRPGRSFRFVVFFLLLGIVVELGIIIRVLTGDVSHTGNVAVIDLVGVIEDPRPTIQALKKFTKQESVKAIVLYINSPGGAVGASQEINLAVTEANKKKPVIASMGDVAASGGYYVAAPARKIVANAGTITGSIGVIAEYFVVGDLLKRWHLSWEVVKAGEVKDIGSPLRPLEPKERKLLQDVIDDTHTQFIEAVAAGRKLPVEKVRPLADGRIFSGKQALAVGLVDQLGGLEEAIRVAAKLANISDEPVVIYPEEESFKWVKDLARGKMDVSKLRVDYRLTP